MKNGICPVIGSVQEEKSHTFPSTYFQIKPLWKSYYTCLSAEMIIRSTIVLVEVTERFDYRIMFLYISRYECFSELHFRQREEEKTIGLFLKCNCL